MSEWKPYRIDELGTIITGSTPSTKRSEYWNGLIPFYSPADFNSRVYCEHTKKTITEEALNVSRPIPENSVMFTCISSIGKIAISRYLGITNQQINSVIANDKTDYKFIYYLLTHYANIFIQYAPQTTIPIINKNDFSRFVFKIPISLPEQRKIAQILSTFDEVIEKTEQAIEKYKAIKQGMMHDLFTRGLDENGKLRPRYEDVPHLYKKTELGWVPKEWEVVSLEDSEVDIIDGDRGVNYPNQNELFNFGFCVFLNAHNVTANGFKFDSMQFITREKDQLMGTGKLMHHDVVITTRGTVGNIAYYDMNIPFEHIRINSGMIILRNRYVDLSPAFLYVFLKEYIFDKEFQKVISGSAQPQLPIRDLKKFRFIKPPEPEQARLIIIVGSIHNKIEQESLALEKLNHLKRGLMQDLLTGRKRVKVENKLENTLESKAFN